MSSKTTQSGMSRGTRKNKSVRAPRSRRNRGGGPNGPAPQKLQRNEVIERGIPGFRALSYRTKLTYYDVATISTGAGSAGTRVYSTNGLYDPDITGAGHQPMPFDQLMLSFEHYVTTSAKMIVNFKNTSTTNTMSVAIGVNAGATPVTAYGTLVENGVLVRDRLSMYPYEGSVKTLSFPLDVAKFGDVRNLLDNPNYEGSVAANPVEQSYFHISCWNPDTVSSTDCICEIYIEYRAVFREPRKNSPSLEAMIKDLIIQESKTKCGATLVDLTGLNFTRTDLPLSVSPPIRGDPHVGEKTYITTRDGQTWVLVDEDQKSSPPPFQGKG